MKTILRNFLSVIRRFKAAMLLNFFGLSIAFAAFILIMMQVDYDYNYNRQIENGEAIFRIEVDYGDLQQAVICRPMAENFFQSSPHILGGAVVNPFWGTSVIEVEKYDDKVRFQETVIPVTHGMTDVFAFDMIEGTVNSIHDPEKMLLPASVAQKLFGSVSVIGRKITLNEHHYTVGGVYKDFPSNTSLRNAIYFSMRDENKENWGNYNYNIFVRLTSPAVADEVLENYHENFHQQAFKAAFGKDAQAAALRLTPFQELHFVKNVDYDSEEKSSRQTIAVLVAIAIALLVIAGINFTNFSMALTPMRVKSINTQKVMGAEQSILRKGILSEAVMICFCSFLLSLFWVWIFTNTGLRDLVNGHPTISSHRGLISITGGIAFLLSLCAGLYPSYYMTSFPPALVLKGTFGLSPKGRVMRNCLLGFQFVASFALIIGASFMYLQNYFIQNTPLGFDKDQLIITYMSPNIKNNREAFFNDLKQFSGINEVTCGQFLLASSERYMGWGRDYRDGNINFQCLPVDYTFLQVMGIDILEGRDFRIEDKSKKEGAYIFNERAKYDYDLVIGEKMEDGEIIGFIPDIKFSSFRQEVSPMCFYVWGTEGWGGDWNNACTYIKVAAGSDMKAAYKHVENTFATFDPGYPYNVFFYDNIIQRTYEKERKMTLLITLFSIMAIIISIVGVFGLVIFESQYKIKEIGLRKVMGSTTQQILYRFNKIYLRILLICFILAVPIGYIAVNSWLENFAYRTPMYWWVFALALLVVGIITITTVTFQNWKAANTNPVESIKTE